MRIEHENPLGLMQESILSPILFRLVLDEIVKMAKNEKKHTTWILENTENPNNGIIMRRPYGHNRQR